MRSPVVFRYRKPSRVCTGPGGWPLLSILILGGKEHPNV